MGKGGTAARRDPRYSVLEGFGTIFSQSVGSTAHATAIHHAYIPEGADRSVRGHVSFSAAIDEKGDVAWRYSGSSGKEQDARSWKEPKVTEADVPDFPKEVVAEMRRLSETFEQRDPVHFMFHALGAVEMEAERLKRRIEDPKGTISHLSDALRDPAAPRKHFVSAEEAGAEKGHHRDSTLEEREERRGKWRESIERAEQKLEGMKDMEILRHAMLVDMSRALRDWSNVPRTGRSELPSEVLARVRDEHLPKASGGIMSQAAGVGVVEGSTGSKGPSSGFDATVAILRSRVAER
jgi:hypothetical protein